MKPVSKRLSGTLTLSLIGAAFSLSLLAPLVFPTSDCEVSARVVEPDIRRKPSEQDLHITSLDKGGYSGIRTMERVSIKDENNWIGVWKRHTSCDLVSPTMPYVDFERSMVLAVFQGESARAGMVNIDRVKKFKDKIVVYTSRSEYAAGSNNRSTMRPYHIVKVSRQSLPVVFY